MSRSGVVLLAVGLLSLGLLILLSEDVPPVLAPGAKAPDFSLPLLGSDEQARLSDYRGQVVLVNLWATWCKPCEEEMPSMERLRQALRDRGFEILAISVDEKVADVEAFQAQMGLSFPIAWDPSEDVARSYQKMGLPESVLVGRDGVVVEQYRGPRDWDAEVYRRRIEALLDEPQAG